MGSLRRFSVVFVGVLGLIEMLRKSEEVPGCSGRHRAASSQS